MRQVLVDRELLERLERSYMDGMSIYGECEELRAILAARPAEAEGVSVLDELLAIFPLKIDKQAFVVNGGAPLTADGDDEFLSFKKVDAALGEIRRLVEQARAALSSVTAERDRLRAENERLARDAKNDAIAYRAVIERQEELRAEAEALRVALFGIASANPAERGIEWAKAYASDGLSGTGSELYNRWLETFKEAEAFRKDAERYRMFRRGMFDPDQFDADIDAALAAQGGAADE